MSNPPGGLTGRRARGQENIQILTTSIYREYVIIVPSQLVRLHVLARQLTKGRKTALSLLTRNAVAAIVIALGIALTKRFSLITSPRHRRSAYFAIIGLRRA